MDTVAELEQLVGDFNIVSIERRPENLVIKTFVMYTHTSKCGEKKFFKYMFNDCIENIIESHDFNPVLRCVIKEWLRKDDQLKLYAKFGL